MAYIVMVHVVVPTCVEECGADTLLAAAAADVNQAELNRRGYLERRPSEGQDRLLQRPKGPSGMGHRHLSRLRCGAIGKLSGVKGQWQVWHAVATERWRR